MFYNLFQYIEGQIFKLVFVQPLTSYIIHAGFPSDVSIQSGHDRSAALDLEPALIRYTYKFAKKYVFTSDYDSL